MTAWNGWNNTKSPYIRPITTQDRGSLVAILVLFLGALYWSCVVVVLSPRSYVMAPMECSGFEVPHQFISIL